MVSFSQPTLHDLSMKVCTKRLKPSTLTFPFATENVLLQRINFHSRQKPFAFHSTSHSSLPVSADSYVAREPRGVHSCLILSRNLIGQRENKRFYVTEIVFWLEFADVSFGGDKRQPEIRLRSQAMTTSDYKILLSVSCS